MYCSKYLHVGSFDIDNVHIVDVTQHCECVPPYMCVCAADRVNCFEYKEKRRNKTKEEIVLYFSTAISDRTTHTCAQRKYWILNVLRVASAVRQFDFLSEIAKRRVRSLITFNIGMTEKFSLSFSPFHFLCQFWCFSFFLISHFLSAKLLATIVHRINAVFGAENSSPKNEINFYIWQTSHIEFYCIFFRWNITCIASIICLRTHLCCVWTPLVARCHHILENTVLHRNLSITSDTLCSQFLLREIRRESLARRIVYCDRKLAADSTHYAEQFIGLLIHTLGRTHIHTDVCISSINWRWRMTTICVFVRDEIIQSV